jgi:pimeloyl-ACP methyl ester carboxylesterase
MNIDRVEGVIARPGGEPVPLLLLPGHVCDYAVWALVLPHLAGHADCRIPEFSDEPSLPAMAGHVLAGAPATFALAGHSMGGRVALEVIRQAPERVERLALLDTGCQALGGGQWRGRAHAPLGLSRGGARAGYARVG